MIQFMSIVPQIYDTTNKTTGRLSGLQSFTKYQRKLSTVQLTL